MCEVLAIRGFMLTRGFVFLFVPVQTLKAALKS